MDWQNVGAWRWRFNPVTGWLYIRAGEHGVVALRGQNAITRRWLLTGPFAGDVLRSARELNLSWLHARRNTPPVA